jgi:peptide deformylase
MQLKLHYYGDPLLRKRCEPVTEITDEIRELVKGMIEMMVKYNGIGIAAPQVGYPLRLFVCCDYIEDEEGKMTIGKPRVYINPKLTLPGEYLLSEVEGCLSIPGIRLEVDRPDKIVVEAQDLDGNHFIEEIHGYNARVRMHENDHINGVLFIDRADASLRKKIEPALKEIKKKYHSKP